MKDDRGGYAMITVLVIIGTVITLFIWATLTIVEQSYVAQERQFARQSELYKAQGELEIQLNADKDTICNQIESWTTPLAWEDFKTNISNLPNIEVSDSKKIEEKSTGVYLVADMQSYGSSGQLTEDEKEEHKAVRNIQWISISGDAPNPGTEDEKVWAKVTATITIELTLNDTFQITNISTNLSSIRQETFVKVFEEAGA